MTDKQRTIDGLSLPGNPGARPLQEDTPAFRLPVRRSLALHPVLAGVVALVVLCGLLGFALSRKPVYRASTQVYVEPIPTRVLGDGTGNYDMGRYESFLQEQMETIARPDILQAAIEAMPPGTWRNPGESMASAVARLDAALKTERVSTSYQLEISVGARTPAAAAAAANAVTEAYLQATHKDTESLASGRLQLLTEERQRIAEEMDARRQEQATLGSSLGVANPAGVGGDAFDTQLQTTRAELSQAREAHDMAAAQLAALAGPGGRQSAGAVASAEESVAADPAVSSLRINNLQRRATLQAQMSGMKPANPLYAQDQAELARLDAQLNSTSGSLQAAAQQRTEAKLRQELQRTGDLEERLNQEVSRDTAAAASAGPKLQRTAELSADLTRLQTRYAAVDDALRSLQLEVNGPGMVHLAVAATAPAKPEPSKSRIVLFVALPLALILGLAAALLATRLDGRVYTADDVEEVLGFAPVGTLPLPEDVSDACRAEYLLRFAAGLEAAHRSAGARSFTLTAASAGSETLPLVTALEDRLSQLGFSTTLLSAGELLRSTRSETDKETGNQDGYALAKLRLLYQQFNLVLISAHPLLHSAEAEYAVRSSDAVILLIESGVTTQREIRQAAALLRRLQARGVGVALFGIGLRNAEAEFRKGVVIVEKRELAAGAAPAAGPQSRPADRPHIAARHAIPQPQEAESPSTERPSAQADPSQSSSAEQAFLPSVRSTAGQLPSSGAAEEQSIPLPPYVPSATPAEAVEGVAAAEAEDARVSLSPAAAEAAIPAEDLLAGEALPPAPEPQTSLASSVEPVLPEEGAAPAATSERGPLVAGPVPAPVTPIRQRGPVSLEAHSAPRRVHSVPPTSFTTRAHTAFRLERTGTDSREYRAAGMPSAVPSAAPLEPTQPPDLPSVTTLQRSSPKLWQVDDTPGIEVSVPAEPAPEAFQRDRMEPDQSRPAAHAGIVRAQRGAGRQWAALSRFSSAGQGPADERVRREQRG